MSSSTNITFNIKKDPIFTSDLIDFLSEIGEKFQSKIEFLLEQRKIKKIALNKLSNVQDIVEFLNKNTPPLKEKSWNIEPLPKRLQNRKIDAGDVSPAFLESLERYLSTDPDQLQGIQVDFDDGHCPTIENQLKSWKNIRQIVQTKGFFRIWIQKYKKLISPTLIHILYSLQLLINVVDLITQVTISFLKSFSDAVL